MSDQTDPFAGLRGFFFAGDKSDPRVNPQLRQRLAIALMQKRAFPKNIGEGLSAIGEAIGDRRLAAALEQQDLAAQSIAAGTGAAPVAAPPVAAPPAQTSSYAPPGGSVQDAPAVQAINTAIAQQPPVADQAPPPGGGTLATASPEEGGYNAIDAAANTDPWPGRRRAVAGIETGGEKDPYAAVSIPSRGGDRAYGKYQIMGKNIPDWTKTATGTALTPAQFLQSPSAQEGTFEGKFGDYVNKYGEGGAARAWYGGEGGMNNLGATDAYGRLNVGQYGQDYLKRLASVPPGGPPDPRDRIVAARMQQTAPEGPQPNPTLAGAQLPLSSGPDLGRGPTPPTDQRLALASTGTVSDIPLAPPQQQPIPPAPQRVAQAQPQAIPGYVPPTPGPVSGAKIIPMSPEEANLTRVVNALKMNNPYAEQSPAAIQLQALQQERALRQTEENERFKAGLTQQTDQAKLATQARIDQAKAIAEEANIRARTAKEGVIDKPYNKYVLQPDGTVKPLQIQGEAPDKAPQVDLTEPQAKALTFHGWAKLGDEGIKGKEQLLAQGLQQELLGKIPFAGNALQSAEYRRVRNNANNFVLAFMRDTSGAAYGAKEMYDHASALLPKYGDDAKTLADKAAQRENFIGTLYGGMGEGQRVADYLDKKRKTHEQDKQTAIDTEMQGAPPPKAIGDTRTNIKTGAKRVWNGKNWLEM